MILHPYLIFKGEARDALDFYSQNLGVEIYQCKTYADSPMPHSEEQKNWLVHGELRNNNETFLMVADNIEGRTEKNERKVQLSLNYKDLIEMKAAFKRLSQGGKIIMPLEKQFWNATFGTLIDKFGIAWMMNFQH